jgi:hypothetical protein
MPHIEMNWADVGVGLIFLSLGVVAAVAWVFVDGRRITAEEARNRRAFEQDMSDVELPEWNGSTYDWTPESLAYLNDTHLYAGPGVADTAEFPVIPDGPVPDSVISGPMPVMGAPAENDPDAFLTRMRAENTAFLANLELQ